MMTRKVITHQSIVAGFAAVLLLMLHCFLKIHTSTAVGRLLLWALPFALAVPSALIANWWGLTFVGYSVAGMFVLGLFRVRPFHSGDVGLFASVLYAIPIVAWGIGGVVVGCMAYGAWRAIRY